LNDAFGNILGDIEQQLREAFSGISELVSELKGKFTELGADIWEGLSEMGTALGNALAQGIGTISATVGAIFSEVYASIQGTLDVIGDLVNPLIVALESLSNNFMAGLTELLSFEVDDIVEFQEKMLEAQKRMLFAGIEAFPEE